MEVHVHGENPFGSVTIQPCCDLPPSSPLASKQGGRNQQSLYCWQPASVLDAQLPPGFCLFLRCSTDDGGIRRFTPFTDFPCFIVMASLGGSAILSCRADVTAQHRFSYHANRLLYQLAPRLREHFNRAFHRLQDLYISKGARIGEDDADVLPLDVKLNSRYHKSPKPSDIIEFGRTKAIEAGSKSPNDAECIRVGLLEEARQNPTDPDQLSEIDALRLVRLGLFDLGRSRDSMPESLVDEVIDGLLPTLERHIDDDTATFNQWFFENTNNLVHVAAKKKRSGGRLPRDIVGEALFEGVFRAFSYQADCVDLQMHWFLQAIPVPLNEAERLLFDAMFLKQSYLGGLCLVLLHDRFDFLGDIIQEMERNPRDRRLIGVFQKMLQFYGEMAHKRRVADRDYKTRSKHRNRENRVSWTSALDPERDPAVPEPPSALLQEIAAELQEIRNITCRCGATQDLGATWVKEKTTGRVITLEFVCGSEDCNHRELVEVSREEFERIGWRLRQD
jgi:hypothetical protein